VPLSEPCAGGLTTTKARASPSTSVPASVTSSGTSSSVVRDCAVATGASLTGFTVMYTVARLESVLPSLARKVKLSAPL
jgi:hypothetical protein